MNTSMSVQDITGRAAARAVSPKKWSRLVADGAEREGQDAEATGRAVAGALLHHFSRPRAPATLVSYLSQALEAGLLTARTFAIALLAHLHRSDNDGALPAALLASIATALLNTPTGLDAGDALPNPVPLPTPDVGTSASGEGDEVPALTLVLPLLRLCTAGSPQLVALAARLTGLISPLPAPPFEAGLEAAQLSAVLPEDVAKPLRDCLAGLMADLPMPAAAPAPDAAGLFAQNMPMNVNSFGELVGGAAGGAPPLSTGPTSLPLRQMAGFLIEYAERAQSWATNPSYASDPPVPPHHLREILRLGRALTPDPQAFLLALLEAGVGRILASFAHGSSAATRAFVFFTEELPVLVRWWRDNADSKWPFPPNLHGALASVFASHNADLANWFQGINETHTAKSSQLMETDEEAGGYTQPEGWVIQSLEATAVRRYLALGLVDEDTAVSLAEGCTKQLPPGESLIERLASAVPNHLDALAYFILYASGAPRSLGAMLVEVIANAQHVQPPENLFLRLASTPQLLALVTAYITPKTLLDLIVKHLLDPVEDQSARAEDPQASLMRFGASVVLAEALCAQFDLALPDLLYEARRAPNLVDLSQSEQTNLNGWIKALFGSDGIDDEIILATSAQGLCRLAAAVVCQAILATMAGQIDLDTLHSGLSYFAQPLLSWCLGGVVGWLCAEIERQGVISGVHLNVLQTLVLDTAFPEPLLRANARAIMCLLDPASGLVLVIESSNFDAAAVRARVETVGAPDGGSLNLPQPSASPLNALRAELQNMQHLDLAAPGWETRMYAALDGALRALGPLTLLDAIMCDALYPSLDGSSNDGMIQFLAFVSALNMPRACAPPLADALLNAYLASLFDTHSPFVPLPPIRRPRGTMIPAVNGDKPPPPVPFATQVLHRLLRGALLASDAYAEGVADRLAADVGDELAFQRTRVKAPAPGGRNASRAKRRRRLDDSAGMSDEQRELVRALGAALEADDELRQRWPHLVPAPAPTS